MTIIKKHKKGSVAFYIIFAAAALVSAIIIIVALIYADREKKSVDNPHQLSDDSQYRVTFRDLDGSEITHSTVLAGSTAPPPSYSAPDGSIFLAWSPTIFGISDDMDVYPDVMTIKEDINAIYANAQYIKTGNELDIPICAGGKVAFCEFQIEISYDSKTLKFDGVKEAMEGVEYKADQKEGKIVISMKQDTNIVNPCQLIILRFSTMNDEAVYTELPITVVSLQTNNNGTRASADYTIIKARAYIY